MQYNHGIMETRGFSGGVFSAAIDGGRAGAEVDLSQTGIIALTPEGQRFDLAYGNCQIEIGGNSGRMVFCRNADRSLTIFCEDRSFPNALSTASFGLLDDQLGAQQTERRQLNRRGRRIAILCLLIGLLLIVGGYFGVQFAIRAAIHALPVEVDQEIGEQVFKAMELEGPDLQDPVVAGAMQVIVDRLAPHAALEGLEFEVHVVDSPTEDSFCLPGGVIVVYSGLILSVDNAEQFAGVVVHEMAHATLRHGLDRMGQTLGMAAALRVLLGDVHDFVLAEGELFQNSTIISYSRKQEAEADAEGVRMLYAADLDPMVLESFFEKAHKNHGDLPDGFAWLDTHPQLLDRMAAFKKQVSALPKKEYRDLEIDWSEVQDKVR